MNKRNSAWLEIYSLSLPDTRPAPYIARVRRFLEWLGDSPYGIQDRNNPTPEEEVRVQDAIRRYLVWLRPKYKLSDGTVNLEFRTLETFHRRNHLPWPFRRGDAPLIREKKVEASGIHPTRIKEMIAIVQGFQPSREPKLVPNVQHRAFLALSTIYGVRRDEIFEFKADVIDKKHSLIYVETAKSGRQRYHLVPPNIMPHLLAWGFERQLSLQTISERFKEMKLMVGLKEKPGGEVAYHGIRRTLKRLLAESVVTYEDGKQKPLSESKIEDFLRRKRGGSMGSIYSRITYVGGEDEEDDSELDPEDRRNDELIFQAHPFLSDWK